MGWLILILAVLVLGGLGGAGYGIHNNGVKQGRAEYKELYEAADKKLQEKGAALQQEAQDHIDDMVVAYEKGKEEADKKVVYIKSKGAADVVKYAVFSDPNCKLPADSLLNLNSARTGVGTAADTGVIASPVRETSTPPVRDTSRDVPADVGGRSPRGKVR